MNSPNPPQSARAGNTSPSDGTAGMRDDAHDTIDRARRNAAGRVDSVADSIDAAASQLDEDDMSRLSGYVHDMASSLGRFADDLRTRSGDDMLRQVNRFARENPAMFIGGSVAIGFGLSRFARASSTRDRQLPLPLDEARPSIGPTSMTSSTTSISTPDGGAT